MKGTNTTEATQAIQTQLSATLTVSQSEAKALIRARRDLRKATIAGDLDGKYDVDVINGVIMILGSLFEDPRTDRDVDFDGRHGK